MTSRFMLPIAAIGFLCATIVPAWAEGDPEALVAAMKNAAATWQGGLKASEAQGTRSRPSSRSRTENCNCRSIR